MKSTRRERFEEDTLGYLEALWRSALRLTMRKDLAEQLVLRTMTRAYRSWPDADDTVSAKVRLFRTLAREYSCAGTHGRHTGWFVPQQGGIAAGNGNGNGDPQHSKTSPDQWERLTSSAVSVLSVDEAIARLDIQPRLIMILLFREHFSYSEIAYITDLPKDLVKSTLGRLRRLIPRYILKHDDCPTNTAESRAPLEVRRDSPSGRIGDQDIADAGADKGAPMYYKESSHGSSATPLDHDSAVS